MNAVEKKQQKKLLIMLKNYEKVGTAQIVIIGKIASQEKEKFNKSSPP